MKTIENYYARIKNRGRKREDGGTTQAGIECSLSAQGGLTPIRRPKADAQLGGMLTIGD